jgi:SAM-dependent methyltransferase
MNRIPKILHFCFGLEQNFGGKPWSLAHFVCVKSALERLKPEQAFIYFEYEPTGPWWEQSRALLTAVKITAPRQVFGNPLLHPAHRADVVRLESLIKFGGIYLDTDVFVHKEFDHLLEYSTVLGEEGVSGEYGLANAVILAEPEAPFLKRWYEEYRWFRSKGHDAHWSEHSVRVPLKLAREYPNEIMVLPHTAFYWPLWTKEHLRLIYEDDSDIESRALATHLWESQSWHYLKNLTPGRVRRVKTSFHRWAAPMVANLPDDFAGPSSAEVVKEKINRNLQVLSESAQRTMARANRARELGVVGIAARVYKRAVARSFPKRRRQEIFTEVYDSRLWGGAPDEKFFSGIGSRGYAAWTYVEKMSAILNSTNPKGTIVDLGCGDFEVGRELVRRLPESAYVGCDIVPELIAHHSRQNKNSRVTFRCLDIVSSELPDGDICLVRQVLQHLSNADIKRILPKLRKFKRVYVTEGYPAEQFGSYNPDKPTDHEVRFDWRNGRGRGVELDKPPFSVATREVFRTSTDEKNILVTFELE